MAMYLGDKPVKAIMRSNKNLLNAPSVLEFKGYTTKYYFPVDLNGTYTFSYNVNLSKVNISTAAFVRVTVDGSYKYNAEFTSSVGSNFLRKMTITGHITSIDFINYTDATGTVTQIMLNEGSTALPYEPYNLLFTAPIKKCVGKNLFDISRANVVVDGEYFNNTPGASGFFYTMRVIAGKTYTIHSTVYDINTTGVGSRLVLAVMAKKNTNYYNGTRLATRIKSSNGEYTTTMKFTVPGGVSWVSLTGLSTMRFKDFMINEGDMAEPYEPYREWYEY